MLFYLLKIRAALQYNSWMFKDEVNYTVQELQAMIVSIVFNQKIPPPAGQYTVQLNRLINSLLNRILPIEPESPSPTRPLLRSLALAKQLDIDINYEGLLVDIMRELALTRYPSAQHSFRQILNEMDDDFESNTTQQKCFSLMFLVEVAVSLPKSPKKSRKEDDDAKSLGSHHKNVQEKENSKGKLGDLMRKFFSKDYCREIGTYEAQDKSELRVVVFKDDRSAVYAFGRQGQIKVLDTKEKLFEIAYSLKDTKIEKRKQLVINLHQLLSTGFLNFQKSEPSPLEYKQISQISISQLKQLLTEAENAYSEYNERIECSIWRYNFQLPPFKQRLKQAQTPQQYAALLWQFWSNLKNIRNFYRKDGKQIYPHISMSQIINSSDYAYEDKTVPKVGKPITAPKGLVELEAASQQPNMSILLLCTHLLHNYIIDYSQKKTNASRLRSQRQAAKPMERRTSLRRYQQKESSEALNYSKISSNKSSSIQQDDRGNMKRLKRKDDSSDQAYSIQSSQDFQQYMRAKKSLKKSSRDFL